MNVNKLFSTTRQNPNLGCSYLGEKVPKLSVDSIKDLTEKQAKELLLKLLAAK